MAREPRTHDERELRDNPVCPHCGGVASDAWEIDFGPCGDGETTITCGHCERDYHCERVVDVTYRTKPLPAQEAARA